jgi:hypothetical protein
MMMEEGITEAGEITVVEIVIRQTIPLLVVTVRHHLRRAMVTVHRIILLLVSIVLRGAIARHQQRRCILCIVIAIIMEPHSALSEAWGGFLMYR